jgi:hypothetical protein
MDKVTSLRKREQCLGGVYHSKSDTLRHGTARLIDPYLRRLSDRFKGEL